MIFLTKFRSGDADVPGRLARVFLYAIPQMVQNIGGKFKADIRVHKSQIDRQRELVRQ